MIAPLLVKAPCHTSCLLRTVPFRRSFHRWRNMDNLWIFNMKKYDQRRSIKGHHNSKRKIFKPLKEPLFHRCVKYKETATQHSLVLLLEENESVGYFNMSSHIPLLHSFYIVCLCVCMSVIILMVKRTYIRTWNSASRSSGSKEHNGQNIIGQRSRSPAHLTFPMALMNGAARKAAEESDFRKTKQSFQSIFGSFGTFLFLCQFPNCFDRPSWNAQPGAKLRHTGSEI